MSHTGLSPADLAEQFRDMCGDGSMEWVYTPMQTWLLLDAADMLAENDRLRELCTDAMRIVCDRCTSGVCEVACVDGRERACAFSCAMHELGIEVDR